MVLLVDLALCRGCSFKVEFVCSAASGSEGGGGSTATLRRLVSRAYGLAHGRVARFSAAFRAIIEGASAAEALSGLLPLRAALLPSLATCPAHRLSSSTVYSAAGGRIFRGVPQTDAADPLPVHWRPGSAATLPTTMTVAAAGGPLTSPPPPPPQALALLSDGTDDGTGSSGGGDAKAPEVASFAGACGGAGELLPPHADAYAPRVRAAGKAFRLLAKHGRFDNLAAAAAAELLVAAARAAAAATAGTAPATALLLAGGGGAPQASSSSSSSHGLLGLGAAAVPVAARLAAIVREALASLGIGRVEAAGPRALRFAVRFDTPAVPAEQRAAGPGGRLAADAGAWRRPV